MVRPIRNPMILLLTFALEYQRVENQFVSLEPVLSQEREHLQNLVARVIALKPDLILVEKTVSRLALDTLLEAGVAVAFNVKPTVIEAVARCTRADIISSIDKLALEPRLGTCEAFKIRTFMNDNMPGWKKTYLFFEGCPRELGCTLVLRGADMATLRKLKLIADLMVFVGYNLKLETFFLRDQFAMSPAAEDGARATGVDVAAEGGGAEVEPPGSGLVTAVDVGAPQSQLALDDSEQTKYRRAIHPFEVTILSASPNVVFPPPYLLSRMKEQE
ncbi:GroEL-like apical domain-containing protein, partial [Blyttiomyces helicus]